MGKIHGPNFSKPAVVTAALGQAIKKVETSYGFAHLSEHGLSPVGEAPHPHGDDEVSLSSPAVLALASDPAHGGKITEGNIQEATVGLMAKRLKALPSLHREVTGAAEFIEDSGQKWDVKSPFSPPSMPSSTWVFDANHQVDNLRHDLSEGENVILDLSRCTHADSSQLLELMKGELSREEKGQVLVFYNIEQNPRPS